MVAVVVDLHLELGGQRIDDGNTDTVQAARHRVRVGVELAAGVELSEHHLDRGHTRRVHSHRDAAAVVDDLDSTVREKGHLHLRSVTCHRLVDGVVDDLPDEVVKTTLARGADVHAGTLTNRLEALEDGDGRRTVVTFVLVRLLGSHGWVALLFRLGLAHMRAAHSCPFYLA